MTTEAEAKTKWCPAVRYVPERGFKWGRIFAAINRWVGDGEVQTNPSPARCIGSDCMWWRKTADKQIGADGFEGAKFVPAGFCGMAGKP